MCNLILMIGVPGSGKTTFCKKQLKENDTYISRDEIRLSLLKENDNYFSKESEVLNILYDKMNNALKEDNGDVYIDATHLNSGSRRKIIQNIKYEPENIIAIFMDTPLDIAIKRNNKRDGIKKVPEKVIEKMYYSIELPTNKEKINKIFIIKNDKINEERRLNI